MTHTHDKAAQYQCPTCTFGPFTRNHYFTGKLLVERDFTDETRFHMEKLRHHEQQLHGSGVVCGLKVKPHPNQDPACRTRFVCIEPGFAVDCCGRDIIVREEECIDITQLPAIKALQAQNDTGPHTLQICIRFRECPTEKIPVLYDDCGCDDTQCAPNRILESYKIDVIIPTEDEPQSFHTPNLKWHCPTNPPHAFRAALHTKSGRLYVITADNNHTVFQIDTENYTVVGSHALPAKGLELAASNDGTRLYVVTEANTDPRVKPRQLIVLDTANQLANNPLRRFYISFDNADSTNSDVFLAVTPDNRLLALLGKTGVVIVWPTTLNDPDRTPLSPAATIPFYESDLRGLVIDSKTARAFTADKKSNSIRVLNLKRNTTSEISLDSPVALALVVGTAPALDMLVVASGQTNRQVSLVTLNPEDSDKVIGSTPLGHEPIALVASPDGQWAYVLEHDATGDYVQAVNLFRLQQQVSPIVSDPFKVGRGSQQIVISTTGTHLYIPFEDDLALANRGGVAVVKVSEKSCEDILWRHLERCPHCDMPDCVVLATIKDYHLGDKIVALSDTSDPKDDQKNQIARIDNRKGRRLLPSTQVLTEVVKCLLDHGTGGGGQQGPPGPAGPAGAGLEEGLTRILALSWAHNKPSPLVPIYNTNGMLLGKGIVIGFSNPVSIPNETEQSAADHVFQVLVQHDLFYKDEPQLGKKGVICRCPVQGRILQVEPDHLISNTPITSAHETNSPTSKGLAFLFSRDIGEQIGTGKDKEQKPIELWVRLRGDFVLDDVPNPKNPARKLHRAVDAEFVRAELPSGDRPRENTFGVQGGLFESWFTIS
jgi:DNA-binding beta-propeller fold protein YncE